MKHRQTWPRQQTMFESERPTRRDSEPVTCLGMTFSNDEARREHFLRRLREGLEELHAKLGGMPFTADGMILPPTKPDEEFWILLTNYTTKEVT